MIITANGIYNMDVTDDSDSSEQVDVTHCGYESEYDEVLECYVCIACGIEHQ